jgi:hypothetical protein
VPYFHLVFTLPHALHALIALRPRVIYEVLFAVASATLTEFGANPRWLGGKLAFSLVLHTWKQDLGRHVHVHALVAGGALTSEGEWKSPKRGFLFPVQALSRVFRGKFLAALSEARGSGRPLVAELADEKVWQALRQQLLAHDWVVYAKQPLGGPEHPSSTKIRPSDCLWAIRGFGIGTTSVWRRARAERWFRTAPSVEG